MSFLEKVLSKVEETTDILRPITVQLPLASVPHLSSFLSLITTTNVHPTYFPYLIFGAIHAARVTTVWASLTRSRNESGVKVGVLQDLLGYLSMAWGGGTVVSLLLGQPPSWLLSPTPWILYTTIYLLLIPTKISHYIVKTAPTLPFNLVMAYIDGLTRGTTIASLPMTIKASGVTSTWFTDILLSGIAISAGGWLVSALGLHEASWNLGVPPVLYGGILPTLDVWGGMLVGLIYGSLLRHHQEFDSITSILARVLPDDVKTFEKGIGGISPLVTPDTGRAICVLLLGSLLAARVVTTYCVGWRVAPSQIKQNRIKSRGQVTKSTSITVTENAQVIKSPTTKTEKRSTPRKSPRAKSVQ